MNALQRQWILLQAIPSAPDGTSVRRLCAVLELHGVVVSKRSVERDLNQLARVFDLETDGERPATWRWRKQRVPAWWALGGAA